MRLDLRSRLALAGAAPDPGRLSFDECERVRCSLTIVFDGRGLNIPWGARPGTATQCIFLDEIDNFSEEDLAKVMALYPWRDLPAGGIIQPGYNGFYPDTNWIGRADEYAAVLWRIRAYGKRFVYHPLPDRFPYWLGPRDGWDWKLVKRDLEPVFTHPGVQAAIDRAAGFWEPPPNTRNQVYVDAVKWQADIFPQAWRTIHMSPNHNAPCDGDPDAVPPDVPDGPAWRNVAPYVHGFLYQSSMMDERREDQFLFDVDYVQEHFDRGINDWPTHGADGRQLVAVGYEYASRWRHDGETPGMEPGIAWGHDMMARGLIRGFGDGSR